MKLIDFEYSNIGERTTQQDFFGKIVNEREAIFVVADGMGGRKGGAMASEIATKTILNSFNNNIQSDSRRDQIRQSIYEANKLILRTGSSNPDLSGMGTTILFYLSTSNRLILFMLAIVEFINSGMDN